MILYLAVKDLSITRLTVHLVGSTVMEIEGKESKNKRNFVSNDVPMDHCSQYGIEEFVTKILFSIEELSQSNQSKFNVTQRIMVENFCPPSSNRL